MGNRRTIIIVAIAAAVLAVFWWASRKQDLPPPRADELRSSQEMDASRQEPAAPDPGQAGKSAPAVESPSKVPIAQPPGPKNPLPQADKRDLGNPLAPASFPTGPTPRNADADPKAGEELDKVALMIRDYRTLTGENPVGTNAEIMKAMMGANPRGANIGPPEGMSLNGEGELLDSWGTPIFFHQLSRDLMEIQSAGPDRRLGTEDDVIFK